MNYLAHAYLSFNNPELLVGNMISDFIKGKRQFDYPAKIQKGIQLHRNIDRFTDAHASTAVIKQLFKKNYGLYSAAFVDIVYDYFLANDSAHFVNEEKRLQFTKDTYELLEKFESIFPEKFSLMFPYMKTQNWLYHYAFDGGIEKSFGGLQRRAKFIKETETAFSIFQQNKPVIQNAYNDFFPEVFLFAKQQADLLSEI